MPSAFTCDNTRTIPAEHVADDYCDCKDGTDELLTGACADTEFVCTYKSKPQSVFSSRVNDGICDCCDGSDEWRSPSHCPDTCVNVAERLLRTPMVVVTLLAGAAVAWLLLRRRAAGSQRMVRS